MMLHNVLMILFSSYGSTGPTVSIIKSFRTGVFLKLLVNTQSYGALVINAAIFQDQLFASTLFLLYVIYLTKSMLLSFANIYVVIQRVHLQISNRSGIDNYSLLQSCCNSSVQETQQNLESYISGISSSIIDLRIFE